VTRATTAPAATVHSGGRTVTPLVAVLAVTQTVGYGVLSYAFTVLLTPIAADLHTTTAAVTGAFTTSVVTSAAAAIPVGRWLDRHGGRSLMTAGSVLGLVAVLAWSQVRHVWQLYPVFVLIGVAAAASLYEAAFPVIIAAHSSTGVSGEHAVTGEVMTSVTLVAAASRRGATTRRRISRSVKMPTSRSPSVTTSPPMPRSLMS